MKKIFFIVAMVLLSQNFFAQDNVFLMGDKVVNIGLGLGSSLYSGTYYTSTIPPLSVSYEQGIVEGVLEKGVIGVGGYLGFSSYKYEVLDWGWRYTNFILGARGSFHYPLVENIDTYTGLLLGYRILSANEFGTNTGLNYRAGSSGVIWAWYAGGRYYFNERLGGMLELGLGITYLNIGIALRI
jgi:hypothetical protein